jgi:cyclic pyranopterin phosphate synthase
MDFTHLDDTGKARMVDVSGKDATKRYASATGFISIKPEVCEKIRSGEIPKGDVLSVARIAAIMAAKRTSDLIPMCHPLGLDHVQIDLAIENDGIRITASATLTGKTGVEMEALTAVSIAALTIYDMCKSADKSMTIGDIYLTGKSGGKSGLYKHEKPSRSATVVGVCMSKEKGTVKDSVGKIKLVINHGVEGDAHAGQPGFEKRQVSLIGIETHHRIIQKGMNVKIGDFAENICTSGVILNELPVGTKMLIGDVELEITQIGKECHTGCAIKKQVGDCPMPREGVFAKVVKGGEICAGDRIEII